ncbi:hypothetical protein BGX21_000964 [Mortierella sp. AD011]|nr:hypothetical protein BGX21_000964 [Mortierella sp. AD011]
MLLRDEDLRRPNLADTFMEQIPRMAGEVQNVSMLSFSMTTGKTNQNHRQEYDYAIRHVDVRRHSIGVLNKMEEEIDFADPKCQSIKVITAGGKEGDKVVDHS